ncbi:MAG: sulfurtransferase, partial [Xanthomonas sp.]|nr:sulfurtransferase [Xanthomonas sp.]
MVTNIAAYHFASIDAPAEFAATLHARAEALSLRGSVLVAGEGLNLFLAGDADAIESFLAPLRADPRCAGLRVKYSSSRQIPFARLKVKVKPEIISFRRPGSTPEDARAPVVEPR